MNVDSIDAIMMKLDVADPQVLFVILAEDGLVNRLGTGAADNADNDLFIGRTDGPLFAQLRALVRPEWLELLGSYEVPTKVGSVCTLTVLFRAAGDAEGGLRFVYGSHSVGPPPDIRRFVTEAVRLTDPWHQKQKRMATGSREE